MATKHEQSYKKSGLSLSMHGNIYQLKIIMLMMIRGLNKNMTFELSTEWVDAEDFNDLVFTYSWPGDKNAIYLQAKHSLDNEKKITRTDFKNSTGGNFSLLKYFNSYLDIVNKSGNKIHCVIATNIKIATALQSNFEQVKGEIINKMLVKAKIYKPILEGEFFKDLIKHQMERTELVQLASKLAQSILEKENIECRNPMFHRFRWFLCTFIFDCKEKCKDACFMEDFKNNTYNEPSLKLFRKQLNKELSMRTDKLILIEKVERFGVSSTFTLLAKSTYDVKEIKPRDKISKEDVESFLRSLRIAITPDENDFRELICNELEKNFGDCHTRNIYSRYLEFMLDWFKDKNGRFLTHEKASEFFDDIREEFSGEEAESGKRQNKITLDKTIKHCLFFCLFVFFSIFLLKFSPSNFKKRTVEI